MFKTRNTIGGILGCLCELAVGILLLINPAGFTSAIIVVVGIVLCLVGVYDLVQYFRRDPVEAAARKDLAKGLIALLLGIFCVLRYDWFIGIFPVLTVLYGLGILVSGIIKAQRTVDMLRLNFKGWGWSALSAVCSIVFALLILTNPFSSTSMLWKFVSICIIIESVLDILALIFGKDTL